MALLNIPIIENSYKLRNSTNCAIVQLAVRIDRRPYTNK